MYTYFHRISVLPVYGLAAWGVSLTPGRPPLPPQSARAMGRPAAPPPPAIVYVHITYWFNETIVVMIHERSGILTKGLHVVFQFLVQF